MTTGNILLMSRVDLELVDYGEDVTAFATVREGRARYVYQVDEERGGWYRRERRGDVRVDRGEVALVVGAAATAGGWIAVDGDIRDTVSWAVRDDRYDPRATPDILALLPSEWREATPIAKAQVKRILDQIDRMARGDEDALAASRARHADIAARLRTHLAM